MGGNLRRHPEAGALRSIGERLEALRANEDDFAEAGRGSERAAQAGRDRLVGVAASDTARNFPEDPVALSAARDDAEDVAALVMSGARPAVDGSGADPVATGG